MTPNWSAGVARITVDIRSPFFVTVYAPFHIVPINHSHRSLLQAGQPMADGAIQTTLDVNPVRKNNKLGKFVHPLPGDLFTRLHIFNDFKCLGSFADRIARMAGLTELNVWNPCDTIPFDIPVAEGTVQMDSLFVMNMIKKNRLLDRFP